MLMGLKNIWMNRMIKKFQRKKENFICENCGKKNIGDGYTNHCSGCLWSKHVDINPGDRANACQGMLEPTSAYFKNQAWRIIHRCQKCGEKKEIKFLAGDSLENLEKVIGRGANFK